MGDTCVACLALKSVDGYPADSRLHWLFLMGYVAGALREGNEFCTPHAAAVSELAKGIGMPVHTMSIEDGEPS